MGLISRYGGVVVEGIVRKSSSGVLKGPRYRILEGEDSNLCSEGGAYGLRCVSQASWVDLSSPRLGNGILYTALATPGSSTAANWAGPAPTHASDN